MNDAIATRTVKTKTPLCMASPLTSAGQRLDDCWAAYASLFPAEQIIQEWTSQPTVGLEMPTSQAMLTGLIRQSRDPL